MNTALIYLLKRNLINQIKNIKKSTGKIVFLILIIIVILNSLISAFLVEPKLIRNVDELYAIIFGFFSLVFIISISNGVENGNSSFLMSDINILFVAPITKKDIFTYGVIKSIGASILASLFILYQFVYLRLNYGLTIAAFFVLFFTFSLYMFLYQLCFLYIYTFVSSNDKKILTAKILLFLPFLLMLAYVAFLYLGNKDLIYSLVKLGNLLILDYIPVLGWSFSIVKYFIKGAFLKSIIFLSLDIVFAIVIFNLIAIKNTNFYEDLIASAQNNEKIKKSRKSGVRKEKYKNKKIKGSTNFGGNLLSVFWEINRLLNKRSTYFYINTSSLVTIIFTLVFPYIIKGNTDLNYISGFSVYMALLLYSNSKFDYHIKKHYIYLIPERPFKKLIALIIPEIYNFFVETVIIYLLVYFISDNSPFTVLIYAILRMSYALLIISTNILVKKIVGPEGAIAKTAFIFIGLFMLAIPSIVGAIVSLTLSIYWAVNISISLALLISLFLLMIGKDILSKIK